VIDLKNNKECSW